MRAALAMVVFYSGTDSSIAIQMIGSGRGSVPGRQCLAPSQPGRAEPSGWHCDGIQPGPDPGMLLPVRGFMRAAMAAQWQWRRRHPKKLFEEHLYGGPGL